MSKKKEEKFSHHVSELKSRRDFLGQGLVAGLSYTCLPGILGLLQANQAYGADCVREIVAGKTPVLIFDLSGGANFAGSNVMVGGAGGQLDFVADYTTLGLPPEMHPNMPGQLNNEFGLQFHSDSALLRGLQSQTNTLLRSKVDGGIFCTASSDDTQNNPHNPMYWLNKAGAAGTLAQLAGTKGTDSGGKSGIPGMSFDPTLRPVQISRPSDALGLVNVGRLGDLFGPDKTQRVMRSIERMSESKIIAFNQISLPEQIKELVKCGYVGSKELIGKYTPDALDPTLDPLVTAAFDNLSDGNQRKTATIAKLVLDGHIGAGTIEKGGYDYHDKTRAKGEQRDFEAGDLIGRVIQLAAAKQKNIMIYVLTDGSVAAKAERDNSAAGRDKYVWTGDSGSRSSAVMMVYRHAGRATLRTGKRQVGHFKDNGSVEKTAMPSSNSVTNLAKLITANYMALHGEEPNLANVVGDNPFGADLDKYLIFNSI